MLLAGKGFVRKSLESCRPAAECVRNVHDVGCGVGGALTLLKGQKDTIVSNSGSTHTLQPLTVVREYGDIGEKVMIFRISSFLKSTCSGNTVKGREM